MSRLSKIWQVPGWRLAALLISMVVIVGLPYIVASINAKDSQQATAWVVHSNNVKAMIYQIAYEVRDSEAAIYRLLDSDRAEQTQDRAARAGRDIPELLQRLYLSTADDTPQQRRIGTLESNVNGRIALMDQAIRRLDRQDAIGARQSLLNAGELFKIDGLIAAIVKNEDNLLAVRLPEAQHQNLNGRYVLSVTSLAQILLLSIIVLASERQIKWRRVAELRENMAVTRAQLILQAVREPIALFDENLKTLLVNHAFEELYGLDARKREQPLAQIGEGAWSDSILLQKLKDVLLRDRELWDYDMRQRTVDGVERHVVINARRLQRRDTDSPGLLLTVSDITARARAEENVKELNRQLEGKVGQISDVNRELEAFSYSVSHDLRAPLRHISGFARKLEQHLGDGADEKSHHYIEVITTSAQRMARLIDDLLVFSRLGRGALRMQPVDMQSLVEEARAVAESDLGERHVIWKIAPLPVVVGDENMLRTVWQNLISNALKYTGNKDVAEIEVGARRGRKGDYVFTVSDNGAGFDMKYADKLFGVFQRLHRASEFPGSGIGLANVRRIVTRHGGRAWADAELGGGARFYFALPALNADSSDSRASNRHE